jgi:hypothetical protein
MLSARQKVIARWGKSRHTPVRLSKTSAAVANGAVWRYPKMISPYAERLFKFPSIGKLEAADATTALVTPAEEPLDMSSEGVDGFKVPLCQRLVRPMAMAFCPAS